MKHIVDALTAEQDQNRHLLYVIGDLVKRNEDLVADIKRLQEGNKALENNVGYLRSNAVERDKFIGNLRRYAEFLYGTTPVEQPKLFNHGMYLRKGMLEDDPALAGKAADNAFNLDHTAPAATPEPKKRSFIDPAADPRSD